LVLFWLLFFKKVTAHPFFKQVAAYVPASFALLPWFFAQRALRNCLDKRNFNNPLGYDLPLTWAFEWYN